MSKERLIGQLLLTAAEFPNDRLKELIEQGKLLGGENGPAWKAVLQRTRKAGLPEVPEPLPLSSVITVDRSVKPSYPDWVEDVLYPGLEQSGPEQFDPAALDQYLVGEQKTGSYETGNRIHDHLKTGDLLDSCLNLQDALAIQQLGLETFRKHFKGKAVFFWKSVVRSRGGDLFVPYLIESDGQVKLLLHWLVSRWHGGDPALRFAS